MNRSYLSTGIERVARPYRVETGVRCIGSSVVGCPSCLRSIVVVAVGLFVSGWTTTPGSAEDEATKRDIDFRIVGYLPDYRVEQIDPSVGRYLTDVVFFSVVPQPQGKFVSKVLDSPKTASLLKTFRDEQHLQTSLCVGGWDRSQGFAEIAATSNSRQTFAAGLSEYCRQHGFAGADLDWEHPKDEVESKNFGLLLGEVARIFKPHHLRLTVAMAAWQTLAREAIDSVDAIHLMSYDAHGKHSTLENARVDTRRLLDAGVPSKKIVLGVPFYGRGITDRVHVKTFAEIISHHPEAIELDEVGDLYFNGPQTIQAKIRFAKEQSLGGVMIWEIGQDAPGPKSLLKSIHDAVK